MGNGRALAVRESGCLLRLIAGPDRHEGPTSAASTIDVVSFAVAHRRCPATSFVSLLMVLDRGEQRARQQNSYGHASSWTTSPSTALANRYAPKSPVLSL